MRDRTNYCLNCEALARERDLTDKERYALAVENAALRALLEKLSGLGFLPPFAWAEYDAIGKGE